MCLRGGVAGHGSMLRECAGKVGRKRQKPRGSYVEHIWLGVWCVCMCVYKRDLAVFSLQDDRDYVSRAKRGQLPPSVQLCSV